MVPLARPPYGPPHRELVCVVLSDCAPLRELLSLLLARRRIWHRTFDRLEGLLAQVDAIVRRGREVRLVVMVGPGFGEGSWVASASPSSGPSLAAGDDLPAARRAAIEHLDAALASVPGTVDLVVFDDAMDGDTMPWRQVQPRLRSAVPPRLFELLRVIDDR